MKQDLSFEKKNLPDVVIVGNPSPAPCTYDEDDVEYYTSLNRNSGHEIGRGGVWTSGRN